MGNFSTNFQWNLTRKKVRWFGELNNLNHFTLFVVFGRLWHFTLRVWKNLTCVFRVFLGRSNWINRWKWAQWFFIKRLIFKDASMDILTIKYHTYLISKISIEAFTFYEISNFRKKGGFTRSSVKHKFWTE